jgi:16S rRNA (guanine(966)-N(2))-methyltransferase RsmD
VRIVAGAYGGRTLQAPRGSGTRPTSDRVREALFSILVSVEGAVVLDLFAGSGALGIEALSRGAAAVTFVDSATAAVAAIRHNLQQLGLEADVLRMPALRALSCTPVAGRQYDLVFVDPPYRLASSLAPELSTALPPILSSEARVVVESDRRAPLVLDLPLLRERKYGDTVIRVHGVG